MVSCNSNSQPENSQSIGLGGNEKLVVIWSSADREVALKMAFMYTINSKKYGWWEDITLVVWGPSAKLLSEDKELQDNIEHMLSLGITVKACKMCADSYGVSSQLEDLGITVKLMSELTDYLKEGRKILTL
ncbi:MAG: DsrE family protein [Spirochaetes bacterium]|nr:DsrE family protein [Spirochaetota bacterium]MBN2772222.1 DsrE family protein [Spirochaetota bacterium]